MNTVEETLRDFVAAYKNFRTQYCKHDVHRVEIVVNINDRGNLCGDLPFLALTCRQVLTEMRGWCFSRVSTFPQL